MGQATRQLSLSSNVWGMVKLKGDKIHQCAIDELSSVVRSK
jgi:hypothetical protein